MKHNVVCLRWGNKYNHEYVNRLYQAVKRNLTLPFEFHCFTDDGSKHNPEIINHPLPYNSLDGWWNKLYLFSNEMPLDGRIFYVDLDTVITGNLNDIVSYDKGFVVLRDFYFNLATGVDINSMGSGLMSWESKKHSHIWESFVVNPQEAIRSLHPHGDQRWVQKHQIDRVYWQDILPRQVVSFKVHCRDGLPENARVICYHGIPSIPESITNTTRAQWWTIKPQAWIAEYWHD